MLVMSNNSRVFRWSNSDELHAMKMHAADIHSRRRAQPFPPNSETRKWCDGQTIASSLNNHQLSYDETGWSL